MIPYGSALSRRGSRPIHNRFSQDFGFCIEPHVEDYKGHCQEEKLKEQAQAAVLGSGNRTELRFGLRHAFS